MWIAVKPFLGALLIGLALAAPQVRAELRGKVSMVVNHEATRSEWRRVPVPGAYVTIYWSVTVPAPAHAITTCRYSEIARSDGRGEYVMDGPNFVTAALADMVFSVYSRGLEQIDFPYGGSPRSAVEITMARSTLPSHERLSRLAAYVDPPCFDVKLSDPRGVLDAYRESVLEEARSLPMESPPGRFYLEHIEAVVRPVPERQAPVRAVVKSSPGAIGTATPVPEKQR